MDVAWVQGVMVVVGATTESADSNPRVVLMMYDPSSDTWESAPAFPGSKKTPGAIVYTAESVLLVGGDHFYEDDTAWEFDLVDRQWRQLPDPGLEPVESMAGVWTGTEAIFYGGTIGGTGPSPARAFDPVQRSWRDLEPPDELMEYPKLLWTGREVLVVPEFPSAGDRRGLRYDPRSGTWSELANIPVDYVQRRSVGWNGARVFTCESPASTRHRPMTGRCVHAQADGLLRHVERLLDLSVGDRRRGRCEPDRATHRG